MKLKIILNMKKQKQLNYKQKKKNPYNLDFGEVSEEDIIKGAVESGVAVFYMDHHLKESQQE